MEMTALAFGRRVRLRIVPVGLQQRTHPPALPPTPPPHPLARHPEQPRSLNVAIRPHVDALAIPAPQVLDMIHTQQHTSLATHNPVMVVVLQALVP